MTKIITMITIISLIISQKQTDRQTDTYTNNDADIMQFLMKRVKNKKKKFKEANIELSSLWLL